MDFPKSVPGVGLVNGMFVDEDAVTGRAGSLIPAAWGNSVTRELLGLIERAGGTPNEADLTQVADAVQTLVRTEIAAPWIGDEAGAGGAYAGAFDPPLPALVDGLIVRFRASHTNAGAATFAPDAGAARPIVTIAHNALTGGEIVAGGEVWLQWSTALNNGAGAWVLLLSSGLTVVAASETVRGIARVATSAEARQFTADGVMLTPKKLADAFSGANLSEAMPGYLNLPNGLTLQWGAGQESQSNNPVTFPKAFASNLLFLLICTHYPNGTTGNNLGSVFVASKSLTGFAWVNNSDAAQHTTQINYLALGR